MTKQTKMIKDYLKSIGYGDIKVRNSFETYANMPIQTLYFGWSNLQKDTKTNKAIKRYYKKVLKHDIKISMETYGIFHELGHLVSWNKDYNMFNFNKSYGNYAYHSHKLSYIKDDYKRLSKYRQLKMERLADKYAYAIYLLNEKSAIEFDKQMIAEFSEKPA